MTIEKIIRLSVKDVNALRTAASILENISANRMYSAKDIRDIIEEKYEYASYDATVVFENEDENK